MPLPCGRPGALKANCPAGRGGCGAHGNGPEPEPLVEVDQPAEEMDDRRSASSERLLSRVPSSDATEVRRFGSDSSMPSAAADLRLLFRP